MEQELTDFFAKQEAEKNARRVEHLRKLGLGTRQYLEKSEPNSIYDGIKGKYYIFNPIDVTNEEYEQICKYVPEEHMNTQIDILSCVKTIKSWTIFFGVMFCISLLITLIALLSGA